jgi:hypothetical protein
MSQNASIEEEEGARARFGSTSTLPTQRATMTTTTGDTMSRFIVLSFLLTSGDAANGTPMTAAQINVANRTNFCPVLSQIQAGTVPIAKALAGSTIQAAIHYGTPSFAMNIDNTTGLPTGGFYYLLQQELARRGGFTFTYNNVPNCMVSLGTQKCLQYNLPHFDIYANNWYSDTSARRFVGIGYTQQLVDASVVFVTQRCRVQGGVSCGTASTCQLTPLPSTTPIQPHTPCGAQNRLAKALEHLRTVHGDRVAGHRDGRYFQHHLQLLTGRIFRRRLDAQGTPSPPSCRLCGECRH